MASRQEYIKIINQKGFYGPVADLLADLFAYYSDNYLADIAGQYYNASFLKATNEDALLQLALDTSYPVWRGTNPIVRLSISPYVPVPVKIQPMQELFSYGKHFFYYAGDRPLILSSDWRGSEPVVDIVYAKKPKRVIEFTLNQNELNIIDDKEPISEHVACYLLYTLGNYNIEQYISHTRYPRTFWGLCGLINNSAPNNSDNACVVDPSLLKDILILTTPRWGIHLKFSDNIFSYNNTRKIRIEYLNHTTNIDDFGIIDKLIEQLKNKYNIGDISFDSIIGATNKDSEMKIRTYLTDAGRFNGVIRSISDIKNFSNEMLAGIALDSKIYHYIDNTDGTIKYLVVFIVSPDFIGDAVNAIKQNIQAFWRSNMPKLIIRNVNSITSASDTQDIVVASATPCQLEVRYTIKTENKNAVRTYMEEYLNRLVGVLIKEIRGSDILSYLSKNSLVFAVENMTITIIPPDEPAAIIFYYNTVEPYNYMPDRAVLLKEEEFYENVYSINTAPMQDTITKYFRYISSYNIIDIEAL